MFSKRLRIHSLYVVAWSVLITGGIFAQTQVPSATQTTSTAISATGKTVPPKPEIQVTREKMDNCSSAIDMTVDVDSETPIDLKRISVRLPSAYVIGNRPKEIEIPLGDQLDINPPNGNSYSGHVADETKWYQALPPLSFHKTLEAVVKVDYVDPTTARLRSQEATVALPVEAPISTVFVGAVLGVFAFFVLAWGFGKVSAGAITLTPKSLVVALFATCVAVALASFSSANLIPLPVNVDLKDSAGGFVVGLAWPALQKTILEKVFPAMK
jgi:hypothetical protein